MKLNNLKIATQLRIALGFIVGLVLVLGAFSWRQTNVLWSQTQTIYQNPFQVVTAAGELEADILGIDSAMKTLMLDPTEQAMTPVLQQIEGRCVDAAARLGVMWKQYLGPRSDLIQLQDDLALWRVERDESMRLVRAGKIEEARERTVSGADHVRVERLIGHIQRVESFARNRSASLYQSASDEHAALSRNLALVLVLVLWLSLVTGGLLLRGIRTPLRDLTNATRQFRQGRLDERSQYVSTNEFGALASSFNTMADEIQTLTQVNEHASELAELMMREDDIQAFCHESLKGLMAHTGSQMGALYFKNEAGSAFVHFESIGLSGAGRATFSATDLEGEMGAVLATHQIEHLAGIAAETRFTYATVSGEFRPHDMITIPVLSGDEVVAVISLASVHAYGAEELRLVHKIWSVLTARVNGVLTLRKIQYFADQLEQQNQELEAQKREMGAQAHELIEQNSELEMQKQQLHEADRLKSAFLSNMSHELRTPLNSVIALSGVLNRRLANSIPKEEYGYIEVIERNGKNLLALINNILDLSRIEAGHEEISLSRFSVREWIEECLTLLEPLAREKNLGLCNRVGDDLPLLTSDPDKCHHILQNLVGNALKFTEVGSVEISARCVDQNLQVAVRDTGIGIDAEHLPHIFDEFRQADSSTSRRFGGSGLGLAIAKQYALHLGGDIRVESVPGEGSTFLLRLPLSLEVPGLAAQSSKRGPKPAADGGPVAQGNGQTILVVEDTEAAIIQLSDILQTQGYQVLVARNGKEALALVEQSPPDAMILDLMMPEVDGFQVLKAIRGEARSEILPVLILTAKHVTKEELSFLQGNHIYQLIQKGDINKDGLLSAVARMVAPAPEPAALRRRPTRPGKALILVVEDHPDNLHAARALLGELYQVIEAVDGRSGLQQASLHQPDLILTDIALPVMDGFEVLAAIRQDAQLRDIPVLALTASAMKGNREEILARGFDGYISKPIDHDTLLGTLKQFLE
jgi:signal transduction histidine kinase/CheY-like chemotaxis protein